MSGFTSPWHWALVIVVFVLLFGAKKLPEAARGLGRSLRIFKSELSQMQNEGTETATPQATTPPAPQQLPPAAPAAQPAPAPTAQPRPADPKSI